MKKTLKNMMLFMITAIMLLTGAVTAYAAEGGIENPYIQTMNGASVMGTSAVIFQDTATGMPAYCIDYNRGIPSPESLSGEFDPMTIFDSATYQGLEYLLLAGYPFETGGLTSAEAQTCTQLAVWCWTYETLGYGLNANNYSATSGREDVYAYFIGLMEAARNQTPPDIGIDCNDIDMIIDGDTLTGTTTVTLRNLQSGYVIDESLLPDDISVSGYTGSDGDVLTFTANMNYAGESVTIANLFTGQDTRSALNLFWYDNSNPNQQRMVISYLDETTLAVAAGISLRFEEMPEPEPEPKFGCILLYKTDFNSTLPLEGAVFGVYCAETNEKLGELVTGEDGIAMIELPVCEVYLLEQTAPEGYVLSEDRIDVSVIGGETIDVSVSNQPIPTPELEPEPTPEPTPELEPEPTEGKIKLFKRDYDNGNLLANAIFGVYRASDDVKICELETNSRGEATSPMLPAADYYLRELKTPDATYQLSTDKYGVTVKADETVEITITNRKIPTPIPTPSPDPEPTEGKIKLIKEDEDSGKRLANVVFGVYRASNNVKICELETNSRGEAVSPLLSTGDYYLRELKTSDDSYELSTEKYGVTVRADKTVEITVTNKKISVPPPTPMPVPTPTPTPTPTPSQTPTPTPTPSPATPSPVPTPKPSDPTGELVLLKKAEQTGNPLAGAVFGVYRVSDNAKVLELTTNADGRATAALAPSDYYLLELKAPYGYLLEETKIFFTIVKDSAVTVEVTNERDKTITDTPTIEIPKTGISVPYKSYISGISLLVAAAVFGGLLLYKRKRGA